MDSPCVTGAKTYRAIQARRDMSIRRVGMDMVIVTVGKAGLPFMNGILGGEVGFVNDGLLEGWWEE